MSQEKEGGSHEVCKGGAIEHVIPFGQFYYKIFKDHFLVITGAGRSGTSVLGRLIGSMDRVCYLFEPTAPKYLFQPELIRAVMFEDHYLPMLQGRNLNMDRTTESWSGYTIDENLVKKRWKNQRRVKVLDLLFKKPHLFAVKLTEWQGMYGQMKDEFPGCKYIHIVRNGNHVIQSAMRPQWYSDFYCHYSIVDWVEQRQNGKGGWFNIPWFIDAESRDQWRKMDLITRNACAWRSATEVGLIDDDPNFRVVKYEDLCADPWHYDREFRKWLGLKATKLSRSHVEGLNKHKPRRYRDVTKEISKRERKKFVALQERLGYL